MFLHLDVLSLYYSIIPKNENIYNILVLHLSSFLNCKKRIVELFLIIPTQKRKFGKSSVTWDKIVENVQEKEM